LQSTQRGASSADYNAAAEKLPSPLQRQMCNVRAGVGHKKGSQLKGGEEWRLGLLLPHTMQYIFALAFVAFWQHFFFIVDSYFFVFVRSFRIFVWISAASQKSFFCGFFRFLFCALHD